MRRLAVLGVLVGTLAFATTAQAAYLVGDVSYTAMAGSSLLPVGDTDWSNATGVDFTNSPGSYTPGVAGSYTINDANGDFFNAGLVGTTGSVKDFSFAGLGSASYPLPPISGYQVTSGGSGFAFDMSTVSIIFQNASVLNLEGTGVFYLNGFTPTPGIFTFNANKTGSSAFSFSATEAADIVPEPGSMMLLGTGLIGLGAAVRRKFAQKTRS